LRCVGGLRIVCEALGETSRLGRIPYEANILKSEDRKRSTGTIRTIKDILGHSSIVTTDIYTHMTDKITMRLKVSLDGMMADLLP